MNSKERVARTLRGEETDRVPIGFFAIDSDTVEKILGRPTYLRAKAKVQVAFWEGRRDEVVESWKRDTIDLYRKLDFLDIVPVCCMASSVAPPKGYRPEAPRRVDDVTWEFKDGRVYKYSELTQDLTMVHDPRQWTRSFSEEDFDTEKATEKQPPPDPSIFEVVDAVIGEFGEDRYILGPAGGEVGMVLLGGMERGLMEFAEHPDWVRRATECALLRAESMDPHYVRPGTDGVLWGQDFAHQTGPLLSPRTFRELCLPSIQRRVQRMHEDFELSVFKHACGNNWKLLGMFVEAGYDAYQSIQISAGMELAKVKAAVGDRLALWAGAQVETLVGGAPEDIRCEVGEAFRALAPGGRFIFSTSHSVAVGTKYENFMAMLDRYLELCEIGA
ncbi:MAG: hypothetical protein M5U26_12825 [Planctomycetota bacterium]|nr:hypothetical protein [Planctomycetota bacterium]